MNSQDLFELQLFQQDHDEKYHRDVVVLGTQNRIKHLILHFAKYLGSLHEQEVEKIVDITICCLSLSNVLNIKLSCKNLKHIINSKENFFTSYIKIVSKMAKACEALDHLEQYPCKSVLTEETINLMDLILTYVQHLDLDLKLEIENRLVKIKEKNIFYKNNSNLNYLA